MVNFETTEHDLAYQDVVTEYMLHSTISHVDFHML